MSIEIEKKYRLTTGEHDRIVSALSNANAKFLGEEFEENIIFAGGNLDKKHSVLRLRRTELKTILAYKERLPDPSDIKHQIEHETEVSDLETALRIFEALGFTRSLVYEKQRGTWHLNDAEVVLDKLPFGLYMEIEGSVEAIRAVEKLLGMEDVDAVNETYPQLTAKFGRTNGEVIEARFEIGGEPPRPSGTPPL